MYTVHRDPRNFFPYPDTFWPERWLYAEAGRNSSSKYPNLGSPIIPQIPPLQFPCHAATFEKRDFRHNSSAFIPFSIGPANCAGKNLALMEMRMLVCSLVQRFEMRFAEEWDCNAWDESLQDVMVARIGELPLSLVKRRGTW